ncbi:hypothetical protein LTR91_001432 [Friedmanniomyces endolithicus]|uniref:Up-regulated during septation protein 1 domain-containing protein n=1 Tax=Friedmanniomyces endolithicus TaxID=329885 RepID=A0AAN6L0R9_9PEZI|nr:hypothetical protein LTR57_006641 [Friedmanniomyces endolithicus]KAK0984041.1 hypothetical protein LTS01_010789 [Friedmanniomyces endolithicus]KAK1013122.1 hypothetical protein LTR91_001432 [Friedmanniomyces endolithicus]KAK1052719.1 hypothetical protein LTS16_001788 [Friedmanniomyces endolithicus]
MERADSPQSLRSHETVGIGSRLAAATHKPSYRLFPPVEPTPPASPKTLVSSHALLFNRAPEPIRRRSSSLDDTARITTAPRHHGPEHIYTTRRRPSRSGLTELKPMSTVQEVPLDSPTVPSRFTFRSFASTVRSEDSGHGRSSSAPSDVLRDDVATPRAAEQEMAPKRSPVWMDRQAAASTHTLHGLGLSLPLAVNEHREIGSPPAKRGPKQKPNLTLDLKPVQQPDRPPPPPPKSPRHSHKRSIHSHNASFHSRSSSVQSKASSQMSSRACSPIAIAQSVAYQPIKPIFVNRTASARQLSTSSEAAVANATSENSQACEPTVSPPAERAPLTKAMLRKAVPRLPSERAVKGSPTVYTPPTSRYSPVPANDVASAEGERTPKAAVPFPNLHKPNGAYLSPAASSSSLVLPETDSSDIPPPTPRKDSFHMQKRSDESTKQHPIKGGTPKSPPSVVASAPTEHPRAHHTGKVSLPVPPTRDPPQRSESRQSAAASPNPSTAHIGKPMLDPSYRPPTPEQLGISNPRRASRVDKPTPGLPFRSATPDMGSGAPEDPAETLRGLARQTEALHARYTSLRSDRQKLTISIVGSLREQKAGPEYVNTMLDQHLSLAAINSSMDICFAKLKSLECRKEEAMTAILAHRAAKRRHEKLRQATTTRSHSSLRSREESGRSTPESAVEVVKAKTSASKLRKDSVHPEPLAPVPHADNVFGTSHGRQESESSEASYKRLTAIQSPVESMPMAEDGGFSSSDVESSQPRKIRIKGAKAAKILGLVKEAADAQLGSSGITLPAEPEPDLTSPLLTRALGENNMAIKVHIPSSPFHLALPPPSPAPTSPLPTPPTGTQPLFPPLVRRVSVGSASSAASGSTTDKTSVTSDARKIDAPSVAGSTQATSPAAESVEPTSQPAQDGATMQQATREKRMSRVRSGNTSLGIERSLNARSTAEYPGVLDDDILDYYHEGGG